MTPGQTTSKRDWRIELRGRLRRLTPEDQRKGSIAIRQRVTQLPQWREARTILLFYSIPGEPDVLPLWQQVSESYRIAAFPAYLPEAKRYVARHAGAWKPGAPLPTGAFGIPEPSPESPVLPWNQLDFVLVPGLGFAPDGRRLGRGKGYYDRLLADVKGFCCGVAFDEQIVDHLPTEPHDQRLDCILTPSHGWHCPQARK